MAMYQSTRFVFFGTPQITVVALEELEKKSLVPALIITAPDAPQGRGLKLTPSPVAVWAKHHSIPTLKPEKLDQAFIFSLQATSSKLQVNLFVVVAYGHILPQTLLDIPKHGVLNMHPSLLPRLRGPSPIRSAILTDEKEVGVSVMLLDEKMDHGPIIAQKKVMIDTWPPSGKELDELLAHEGGKLLAEYLPRWVVGEIEAHAQNDDLATYCKMFTKEDGLLDLSADPYHNLLKIRAFEGWPCAYALFERNNERTRVKILDAHLDGARGATAPKLVIDRVKPDGKSEMNYQDFLRSGAQPV